VLEEIHEEAVPIPCVEAPPPLAGDVGSYLEYVRHRVRDVAGTPRDGAGGSS
jgi:hypothetical protein